jgi:hypothetical protein
LILFLAYIKKTYSISYYSVGKVLAPATCAGVIRQVYPVSRVLTGERCSPRGPSNLGAFVKGIGCLSIQDQFSIYRRRPGKPPGRC